MSNASGDLPPDGAHHAGTPEQLGRRGFMGAASSAMVSIAAAGTLGTAYSAVAQVGPVNSADRDRLQDLRFIQHTLRVRVERAGADYALGQPEQHNNGDEARYPSLIGADTRGLPHDRRGEVDLKAWASLKRALTTQDPADFEKVILGGTRKLVQPLATLAVNLSGAANPQLYIPPAPALASAEKAAEGVESYWQSLLRDVPFHAYRNDTTNELVLAAAEELTGLRGYTGPRDAQGRVTPELLFRGTARYFDPADRSRRKIRSVSPPGVNVGPYISQFILKDIPYATNLLSSLLRTQKAGSENDFLVQYDEWLANQDGRPVTRSIVFDGARRYLSTGRDLAEYVHGGSPGFWGAALLLGTPVAAGGFGAPFNPTNPYLKKVTTSAAGVGTFGLGAIQGYLPLGSSREIRANYWQKWFVHRTPRPEAYGGLVHQVLAEGADYPLHDDVLSSEAVERSFRKYGTYLISSAYPEGAPNHSSYPGGASASASVNATLLKAFFDEDYVLPNPVQPDPKDPTKLIPYEGPPLTVGGELNKLATNLGQGRNWAGIHWRSDAAASLPQAEEVAITLLRDERATFREPFDGFAFSRFDGTRVTV
jgi:hypothetical protein